MDAEDVGKCGCYLVILLFNMIVGAWSVNYLLLEFLGRMIPFWGAALIGVFAGEISISVAIVVWLLKAFGVM
jgi:hypothetical protein